MGRDVVEVGLGDREQALSLYRVNSLSPPSLPGPWRSRQGGVPDVPPLAKLHEGQE